MTPTQPPVLHDDLRARLDEMAAFLDGSGSLDGRDFSDLGPIGAGGIRHNYWWRTKLREIVTELRAALSTPAGEAVGEITGTYNGGRYSMALLDPKVCPIGTKLFTTPQPTTPASGGGKADAWISTVMCVGPEYGKEIYGKLPVQSLQPGYYSHTPLYTTPPAAIPVDALRELVADWRDRASGHAGSGSYRALADELAALIAPASIGAEAQEGSDARG